MRWYVMPAMAVFNGMLITLSASLNARLGESAGPLKASLRNHSVGAALMLVVLLGAPSGFGFRHNLATIPFQLYLGGAISAGFVAIYSHVVPRIGVMRTLLLIISGQMLTAVFLDLEKRSLLLLGVQMLGVLLILTGVAALHRRPAVPSS